MTAIGTHHVTVLGLVGGALCGCQLRLRLVTSQGSPYPSRSPRAHPSGWTRTQGLSHRDSHAPPSFGTTPVRMWNWPLAPLLRRAGNQVVREMPSHTRPSNPEAGSESSDPPRRPLTITRRNGTNGFNGCHGDTVSLRKLGRPRLRGADLLASVLQALGDYEVGLWRWVPCSERESRLLNPPPGM